MSFNVDTDVSTRLMINHWLLTGQRLLERMPILLKDLNSVKPCLLHGDLWSGNVATDTNGAPVILDPACYCEWEPSLGQNLHQ